VKLVPPSLSFEACLKVSHIISSLWNLAMGLSDHVAKASDLQVKVIVVRQGLDLA
jgi:hypothetical protein